MGEKKFTFLELHLDGDTQIGPKSASDVLGKEQPGATEDLESEDETEEAAVTEDEEGGSRAVGVIVALVVLAGIAFAARKLRGEDEAELPPEEEPDVIVN